MIDKKLLLFKQYMTPVNLSEYIVSLFVKETDIDILEPSCGTGSFLEALPKDRNITAVELDTDFWSSLMEVAKTFPGKVKSEPGSFYNKHLTVMFGDFLSIPIEKEFDLVIGNPPFGSLERGGLSLDAEFVKKGLDLLKPNGRIVFLLETKFLHGVKRYEDLWRDKASLLSLNLLVRRPVFQGFSGTATRDCAIFEISKKIDDLPQTNVRWVSLER